MIREMAAHFLLVFVCSAIGSGLALLTLWAGWVT